MNVIEARITIMCVSLIVMGLLIIAPSYGKIDPETIVAAWLFDGDVKDASGNGYDGKIQGKPKFVAGKFGKAIELNGTSDWVEIEKKIGAFQEVSIIEWANVTGRVSGWRVIYNVNGWKAGDIHHQLHPNNKVEFSIHSNPGGNDTFGTFMFDKDNLGWVHIATVYSTKEKKIRFFINGELDAENNWGGNEGVLDPGRIGSWDGGGREWQGMFDELIMFNVALDKEDIKTLMENGFEKTLSVQPEGKIAATWGSVKAKY